MNSSRRQTIPPPAIEEFVAGKEIALIEFWVAWSGESFIVGKAVEKLIRNRPGLEIHVGRVDADDYPEVCARFHAVPPPVLLLFRNGRVVARHRGLITTDGLAQWLDNAIATEPHPQEEES